MTTSITGQGITAYKVPDDALSNESKNERVRAIAEYNVMMGILEDPEEEEAEDE